MMKKYNSESHSSQKIFTIIFISLCETGLLTVNDSNDRCLTSQVQRAAHPSSETHRENSPLEKHLTCGLKVFTPADGPKLIQFPDVRGSCNVLGGALNHQRLPKCPVIQISTSSSVKFPALGKLPGCSHLNMSEYKLSGFFVSWGSPPLTNQDNDHHFNKSGTLTMEKTKRGGPTERMKW